MPASVRKAVFPAAGLGTRFLPATKAMPKEMLSLVDKPIIQYGVEEALQSGIENIILVTARGKSTIEDHFDVSFELESVLESRGKTDLLQLAQAVSHMANISYVRQKQALGLGQAVLCAAELVGPEPFACVLPDDVIDARTPCIRQLLDVYEYLSAPVLAVMEVAPENISSYGAIAADPVDYGGSTDRVYRIRDMVEKPAPSDAPSNLAIIGRYILTPDIFGHLRNTKSGSGGEIQLTDGIRQLLRERPVYAVRFEGDRYDAGDKFGFLQATVALALQRSDLGPRFRDYLRGLKY